MTMTRVPDAVIAPEAVDRSFLATAYAIVVVGITKNPATGQNQEPNAAPR